jgi:hypothetical protein
MQIVLQEDVRISVVQEEVVEQQQLMTTEAA